MERELASKFQGKKNPCLKISVFSDRRSDIANPCSRLPTGWVSFGPDGHRKEMPGTLSKVQALILKTTAPNFANPLICPSSPLP